MKKVKVYSTPSCPYCHMAKRYLNELGVHFEDLNVATDINAAREMISKSGQQGVPVIDIDGDIIIGFDQRRIAAALG